MPSCCPGAKRIQVGAAVDLFAGTEGDTARSLQQGSKGVSSWGRQGRQPTHNPNPKYPRTPSRAQGGPMAARPAAGGHRARQIAPANANSRPMAGHTRTRPHTALATHQPSSPGEVSLCGQDAWTVEARAGLGWAHDEQQPVRSSPELGIPASPSGESHCSEQDVQLQPAQPPVSPS